MSEIPKSPVDILKAARDLISDRKHWTKGDYARDSDGRRADRRSLDAACFCAIGAISRVAGTDIGNPVPYRVMELFRAVGIDSTPKLVGFNDTCTHEQVLQLFDRAIEEARRSE